VARINLLRFITGDVPSLPDLLATMTKRARRLKLDRTRPEDVARSGGAPDEGE
jgi:ParB family chromosome partitioning protein